MPFPIAVLITLEDGWHTYWRDPGDSGMEPVLEWNVPPGFEVGPIRWPEPKRYEDHGIVNFIYEERVLLMADVTPPAMLPAGTSVTVGCDVTWMICRELCRVMDAELRLELPVLEDGPAFSTDWRPLFERTRTQLPNDEDRPRR